MLRFSFTWIDSYLTCGQMIKLEKEMRMLEALMSETQDQLIENKF